MTGKKKLWTQEVGGAKCYVGLINNIKVAVQIDEGYTEGCV